MKCMVSISFLPERKEEIAALVPQERTHVKELMDAGIIKAIYISADRLHVWMVMEGRSQQEVEEELKKFPLYAYMVAEFIPLQ